MKPANRRPTVHRLDLDKHVVLFVEETEEVVLVSRFGVAVASFDQTERTIRQLRKQREHTPEH